MKGNKKFWILSLVFALVAAVLFYQFLMELQKKYQPKNLQAVVVAARDIEENTLIEAGDVRISQIPAAFVHPQAIRHKKAVIGKISISKIAGEEQVLSSRLLGSGKQEGGRMSYSVPPGKRAISIAVNDVTSISGFVRQGDRVDVVATLNIPVTDASGRDVVKAYSTLALQDIEVLAVGNNLQLLKSSEGEELKDKVDIKTLTLAVAQQEALQLTLAAERGEIRLMLRPPGEKERPLVPSVELRGLMTIGQPMVPQG